MHKINWKSKLKNECHFVQVYWEVTAGTTEKRTVWPESCTLSHSEKLQRDILHTDRHTRSHGTSYGTKGQPTATLCNATLMTNSFPPRQPWGLSILSFNITFPLDQVPAVSCSSSPLRHRSCVLLISITHRFHFPGQRRRKSEWNEWGSNWNPHPSQHIQHLPSPSTLLDGNTEQQHRLTYGHTHTYMHTQDTHLQTK